MSSASRTSTRTRSAERSHVFATRGVQSVVHPAAALQLHPKQTEHFKVSVDPGLGSGGIAIADSLLKTCEQDFATLQTFFGGITPNSMPFHLIVTAGSQGASHATCAATTLSFGAHSGPLPFI